MNLAEIKARAEAELPEHPDDFLEHCLGLVSWAREIIPALIAEVERLREELNISNQQVDGLFEAGKNEEERAENLRTKLTVIRKAAEKLMENICNGNVYPEGTKPCEYKSRGNAWCVENCARRLRALAEAIKEDGENYK